MAAPEKIEPVAQADQAERAEADRYQQDDAEEQGLPERIEIEHEQQIADGTEDQRTEDRADGAAAATKQGDATQHHRGNGVQRVGVGVG